MSLENPKQYLAVLDVGHGSAAVLHDEGGVVVFDTGRGAHVDLFLSTHDIDTIEMLLLSHADSDHIGGAITILLNANIKIGSVYLNPDPTKNTDVFLQLRYSLCEAQNRAGTNIQISLTTDTKFPRKGSDIEVLYPHPATALGGVGGNDLEGNRLTSNSLSAAIRIKNGPSNSILLGGDVEFCCLDEWKKNGIIPNASVLVFPHHGGLPSSNDPEIVEAFATEITKLVKPQIVVFSIHRTKYGLPRDITLSSILEISSNIRFLCTQLPVRFHALVAEDPAWSIHRCNSGKGYTDGIIEFEFLENSMEVKFLNSCSE
jgi:beta-lactamase superfamily II metal-dependent hydrolase